MSDKKKGSGDFCEFITNLFGLSRAKRAVVKIKKTSVFAKLFFAE